MRGANQNFKMRANHLEDHVRESDHILHQIGHIKETVSPYLSNTKMSDGQKEKWFQYLPNQNANSNNFGSVSRQENRNDNYLLSLERRLEKLFREEKEMLRERHNKNELIHSQIDRKNKRSVTNYQASQQRPLEGSYNIDNMERKIRQLEQRYRQQDFNRKEKSLQKPIQDIVSQEKKSNHKVASPSRKFKGSTEKINQEYSPTYNQNFLTQSVEECLNKEKYLQEEVQSLKKSVRELHQNNRLLLKRIQTREQKKRHKYRTKQLLQNILHKLQFINIEIKSAKKRESKPSQGKMGKIQRETQDLCQQFEQLRLQYKHLEGEKLKFQKKQLEIEKKLEMIAEHKNESKS